MIGLGLLLKAKYIKRTGVPGHYKYWYRDEKGNVSSGSRPSFAEQKLSMNEKVIQGLSEKGMSQEEIVNLMRTYNVSEKEVNKVLNKLEKKLPPITAHYLYSKLEYDYFKKKGYSDEDIRKIWDMDSSRGATKPKESSPQPDFNIVDYLNSSDPEYVWEKRKDEMKSRNYTYPKFFEKHGWKDIGPTEEEKNFTLRRDSHSITEANNSKYIKVIENDGRIINYHYPEKAFNTFMQGDAQNNAKEIIVRSYESGGKEGPVLEHWVK